MAKTTIGPRTILYPMPTVLVGVNVDEKPNFMAVAYCGVVNSQPPMLSVSLQHPRHTLKGVKQNNTFSVNIASVCIVKETDYCGLVSGSKTDKVNDCNFHVFFGKLKETPLITECPVNIECRVVHMLNLGSHVIVIGQVEEVHVTDSCFTNGEPDVDMINPFLFVAGPNCEYRVFGKPIGKAFSMGKEMNP